MCEVEEKKITGAEAVIKSLIEEGVTTLFGYIGGAIMPVYDALFDHAKELNHILSRHEQGAIHAAQGFARVSGKTGVCFATSGPGATNLITGIADAMLDSTPLVCITGQVPSPFLGSDAFQETDIVSISVPVTKWNFQVTSPHEIPTAIAKAFYIARSGRPGPVLIDLTKDAQAGLLEYKYKKCDNLRSYFPYPKLNRDTLKLAGELIDNSKKPMLLAGQGILLSEAEKELVAFAEKTQIPVASTLLGLSAFPTDHPLYVGMLGMHGNYAPNMLTNECDLLIAVGMRFDDRVTGNTSEYGTSAKIIHIDIDHSEINKNIKVDIPFIADALEALEALNGVVKKNDHKQWLGKFEDLYQTEKEAVIDNQLYPTGEELRMGEAIRNITEATDGNAVVVTDVGQHQMKTGRYYRFKQPHSFVTSGGLGTMGFGLPASIGAAFATQRQVVAIIGDGGFQMTLQELATIRQNDLPLKIFILDNNFLGMVRQWQEMFFHKKYSYTELTNPDFVQIAKGFGIPGERVDDRDGLRKAIDRAFETEGPYLLDIAVTKEDNVFPMVQPGDSVSQIRLK